MAEMAIMAHAILLILLPIAIVVMVMKMDRRTPTKSAVVCASLLSVAAMAAAINFTHHLCDAGQPFFQWLIPGPMHLRSPAARTLRGHQADNCTFALHRNAWTFFPLHRCRS
jgi:hypothetical protein